MPLSAIITPAVLDKVLGNLAVPFLVSAGGNLTAARYAASKMLAGYDVVTGEELCLAADIISFGFQAQDALGQAMAPDLPLKDVMDLRKSAVTLNRESHRCQRKLDQLRKARLAAIPDVPPDCEAPELVELAREMMGATVKSGGLKALAMSNKQPIARDAAYHAQDAASSMTASAATG